MFHAPMRFEAASEMIEARQDAATAMDTRRIAATWSAEARQRAFFSARVAEVSILKELHRVCAQVVEGKMSPKQATRLVQDYFVGEGADALARLGFAPPRTQRGISELGSTARLMLIFNTNLKLAQETGHYRQWSQVKEVFPYGIWHCGNAKEHRKEHLARDGKAFPFNHPIWTVSPPGGEFNCHCWREVISAEELERRGITPEGEGFKFEPSSLGFDPSRSLDEQPIPPSADLPPGIREQAERKLAEEEARRKAEEEARRAAEEEARRKAEAAAQAETPEAHAAKRQEQWQKAYEKRRDEWEQSIVDAAPVDKNAKDYEEQVKPYKELAAILKGQYTQDMAKIIKPPKVIYNSQLGKRLFEVNADGTQILVASSLPHGTRLQIPLQNVLSQAQVAIQQNNVIQQNTASMAKLLNAKMINGNHTPAQDAMATNPNYNPHVTAYSYNCQRCVSTYEARRRGLDVSAKPTFAGDIMPNGYNFLSVYKNGIQNVVQCSARTVQIARSNVENEVLNAPDGARFIVRIGHKRNPSSGHVFIAEKHGGTVTYIDPQLHNTPAQINAATHWGWASGQRCWCLRVDNLEFTNILKDICQP